MARRANAKVRCVVEPSAGRLWTQSSMIVPSRRRDTHMRRRFRRAAGSTLEREGRASKMVVGARRDRRIPYLDRQRVCCHFYSNAIYDDHVGWPADERLRWQRPLLSGCASGREPDLSAERHAWRLLDIPHRGWHRLCGRFHQPHRFGQQQPLVAADTLYAGLAVGCHRHRHEDRPVRRRHDRHGWRDPHRADGSVRDWR